MAQTTQHLAFLNFHIISYSICYVLCYSIIWPSSISLLIFWVAEEFMYDPSHCCNIPLTDKLQMAPPATPAKHEITMTTPKRPSHRWGLFCKFHVGVQIFALIFSSLVSLLSQAAHNSSGLIAKTEQKWENLQAWAGNPSTQYQRAVVQVNYTFDFWLPIENQTDAVKRS